MDYLTIGLPSGVGDCLWAVAKLRSVGPFHFEIADGWPYRTKPWFDLLDCTASVKYGEFSYTDILAFQSVNNIKPDTPWAELSQRGYASLLIEPNKHLERGHPLKDWLPDLPTDYHIPMVTAPEDRDRAAKLLAGMPRPIWGISAASYRGSEAWKTWGYKEWSPFLKAFHAHAGGTILLLGGFWDDLTSTLAEDGYADLVGKTSMGCMVEILKHLEGYIGFSSGMGMLNTALWGNTFMLWPEHQVALSTSWADPAMLEAGTYQASLWRDPMEVLQRVKGWLKVPRHPERAEHQR